MGTRKCKVCDKLMLIKVEKIGKKGSKLSFKSGTTNLVSDDGVMFKDGETVWFCNDCWKLINND